MNKKDFFELPENSKEVFKGERWSVFQWEQKQFDGTTAIFETIKRSDTVIVIPVMPDGKIVIQQERQPHWDKSCFSITAGGIEENETPRDAAKRETEEEIGMVFSNFHLVNIREFLPGVIWKNYTFVATGFEKHIPQSLDSGEQITPKIISKEKLVEMAINSDFRFHPKLIEDFLLKSDKKGLFSLLDNPKNFEINPATKS